MINSVSGYLLLSIIDATLRDSLHEGGEDCREAEDSTEGNGASTGSAGSTGGSEGIRIKASLDTSGKSSRSSGSDDSLGSSTESSGVGSLGSNGSVDDVTGGLVREGGKEPLTTCLLAHTSLARVDGCLLEVFRGDTSGQVLLLRCSHGHRGRERGHGLDGTISSLLGGRLGNTFRNFDLGGLTSEGGRGGSSGGRGGGLGLFQVAIHFRRKPLVISEGIHVTEKGGWSEKY